MAFLAFVPSSKTAMWGTYISLHSIILREYAIYTSREKVRKMLKELDPVGVGDRRAQGLRRTTSRSESPNLVRRTDGYDKLKAKDLPSMALECSYTNNDPAVIAGYCVSTFRKLCYRPRKKLVQTVAGRRASSQAKL